MSNARKKTTNTATKRAPRDFYHLHTELTAAEEAAYRKGQHATEARSMSAFVRECVQIRLDALGLGVKVAVSGEVDANVVPASFEQSGETA